MLTDRDLDELEAQLDDTVPYYVPALIRALRETRAEREALRRVVAEVTEIAREMRELLGGSTDGPVLH